MINLPRLQLDPGAEYDFAISDSTNIEAYTVSDWSGDALNTTVLNSEDGSTQAEVTIPQNIYLSYTSISNIAVTGAFKIYADRTCTDGGNNNANVVFVSDFIIVLGVYKAAIAEKILVGGVWKTVSARSLLIGGAWKT
jgi:hypothetical protein